MDLLIFVVYYKGSYGTTFSFAQSPICVQNGEVAGMFQSGMMKDCCFFPRWRVWQRFLWA